MQHARKIFAVLFCLVLFCACRSHHHPLSPEAEIGYCITKATLTLSTGFEDGYMPRNIKPGQVQWNVSRLSSWTAGYWPGTLWYIYEYTGEEYWREKAMHYTNCLKPNWDTFFNRQDFGLSVFLSFGQGYRLTGDSIYKNVLLQSAAKIKELPLIHEYQDGFSDLHSLDQQVALQAVINEMRSLVLLFWAGNNGCDQMLAYARRKADECYGWVNEYFPFDAAAPYLEIGLGENVDSNQDIDHKGNALLSKDVAWLIYGFTALYQNNREPRYLLLAQNLADFFISRLPADHIPYWTIVPPVYGVTDFKDASAAAIAASALVQLAGLTASNLLNDSYIATAEHILKRLSSKAYRSNDLNHAFIMHSMGNGPHGSEVDVSLIYSDFYYLEALMKYKQQINKRAQVADL